MALNIGKSEIGAITTSRDKFSPEQTKNQKRARIVDVTIVLFTQFLFLTYAIQCYIHMVSWLNILAILR